jgi:thioredoxin reductase (NADPH)
MENITHTTDTENEIFDAIIIGGGVAALSAGIYLGRDNFKTLILEGTIVSSTDAPGGALLLTNSIENFPGFIEGEGYELIEKIRSQAENFGADIREERATNLEASLRQGTLHTVTTDQGNVYQSRAIIIATGAVARRLGIPGEETLFGQGVSTCATCDGWAFKEKTVIVVGGGDTAVEDALLLTKLATKVYIAVRGTDFRSQGPEAREVKHHEKIKILYNTTLEEIIPDSTNTKVASVKLKTTTDGTNTESELEVDGVFVAIGSDPATEFLTNSNIIMDTDGYILTSDNSTKVQGAIPGVFAAGDVNAAQKNYRQAITSAGNAVQAALETRVYLNSPVPEPLKRSN